MLAFYLSLIVLLATTSPAQTFTPPLTPLHPVYGAAITQLSVSLEREGQSLSPSNGTGGVGQGEQTQCYTSASSRGAKHPLSYFSPPSQSLCEGRAGGERECALTSSASAEMGRLFALLQIPAHPNNRILT